MDECKPLPSMQDMVVLGSHVDQGRVFVPSLVAYTVPVLLLISATAGALSANNQDAV